MDSNYRHDFFFFQHIYADLVRVLYSRIQYYNQHVQFVKQKVGKHTDFFFNLMI